MNRFQKWALATTIATFLIILVGGLVRASDAGLGCPDWPKCFGRFYPPLTESQIPNDIDQNSFDIHLAWIEYTNRLVGVIVGLLILGTLYHAVKSHRHNHYVLYPVSGAFILVLFQGWLGGELVKHELKPWHITLHFVLALVIAGLLIYATISAFFPNTKPYQGLPPERRMLGWLALLVLCLTLIQTILGTEVRGQLEVIEKNSPNLARDQWIHETTWVEPVHRSFSWLILLGVIALNVYIQRRLTESNRWLQWAGRALVFLVIIQIAAGIGMVYGSISPALEVVHLVGGSLFMGVLLGIYLLASRLPVEAKPPTTSLQSQPALSEQAV